MSDKFLTGAACLIDGAWLHGHGLKLQHGLIEAILPDSAAPETSRIELPRGSLLAPGMIDIQVNGGGGLLFNDDPSPATALAIAQAHRRRGTTSILPTLITDTPAKMRQAATTAHATIGSATGVLGVHFEGPFLSAHRPGVHDAAKIRQPDEADFCLFETLAKTLDGKVLLTLAPESVETGQLDRLAAAGVILSAGHSTASFERMAEACGHGVTGVTHLFNAMPPPAAREPGPVAAALLLEHLWCGVIVDGIHVHPAMLRLLLATKPRSKIFLVSDAMPPTGSAMQKFQLHGKTICRRDGKLVTEDGILAGADLCLAEAVRNTVRLLGLTPAEVLPMASTVPAAFLGLDQKLGRIAPGLRADLVLLSENLDVLGTWRAGAWESA